MKNFIISLLTALLAAFIFTAIGFTWLKMDLADVQNQVTELQTKVDALPTPNGLQKQGGNLNQNINTQDAGVQNTNVQDTNTLQPNQQSGSQDQGPLNHSVYVTSSTDPNSFENSDTVVFEKASVPDAVLLHTTSNAGAAGDVLMYFPSFENFTGNGSENIAYSRSTDNGATWSERATTTITGKTNAGAAVDPSLVQLEDGRLRMYFFGSETTKGDPASVEGNHVIYSAVSNDGINFTVEAGERIAVERITDPEVVQFNDQWIMYMAQGTQTLIATSDDGLDFTLTDQVWTEGGIPGAYVDNTNLVHLYGCGKGGIVTQTSTDGITFSTSGAVPALQGSIGVTTPEIICDPSPVLLDNDTVLFVYKKAPPSQFSPQ